MDPIKKLEELFKDLNFGLNEYKAIKKFCLECNIVTLDDIEKIEKIEL